MVLELVCKNVDIDGMESKVFSVRDVLHEMEDSLPWNVRLKAASDISNGMEYIHDNFLVHGDLKSSNVLVDERVTHEILFISIK